MQIYCCCCLLAAPTNALVSHSLMTCVRVFPCEKVQAKGVFAGVKEAGEMKWPFYVQQQQQQRVVYNANYNRVAASRTAAAAAAAAAASAASACAAIFWQAFPSVIQVQCGRCTRAGGNARQQQQLCYIRHRH